MWLRVLMYACVMMNLMLTSRSRLIRIRLLAERAEQLRAQEEEEIKNDYKATLEPKGRHIEHLVLVTHGIGQLLGMR